MRPWQRTLVLLAALCAALLLAGCGRDPVIERVDVTWTSLDPAPRWGLYPGYRQELEFRKRSSYQVDVYVGGKKVTGGAVGDTGYSLAFLPGMGALDIEAEAAGPKGLNIFVTLKNEKSESRRLPCLKIERNDEKIWFEVPKQ